jgi:hypothetical protein
MGSRNIGALNRRQAKIFVAKKAFARRSFSVSNRHTACKGAVARANFKSA